MQTSRKVFCAIMLACSVLFTTVDSVDARPQYGAVFKVRYAKYYKSRRKIMNCFVCHGRKSDGKPDLKCRNNYGQVVRRLLGGKNEKDRSKIHEALKKAEKEPSAIQEKTFGDLIKEGKLPASGWSGVCD